MPGPPSLLENDPELAPRFLALIRDGVPRSYAALGCGFSYRTLYGWVRQGLVPGAREPYKTFARDLYRVEVEVLRDWLVRLNQADIETDNRALVWLLERRFPKAFGKEPEVLAEPADDVSAELEGDAEHWSVLRQWFLEPTPQLLELMSETGYGPVALRPTG